MLAFSFKKISRFHFLSYFNDIIIFYMRSKLFRNHIYITNFLWHRSGKGAPQTSSDRVNSITDAISELDIDANVDSKRKPTADNNLASGIKECKCGMPLCICQAPAPSSSALPQEVIILIVFIYLL